eukprot:8925503-Alexandrium_andersonii.AAC.1
MATSSSWAGGRPPAFCWQETREEGGVLVRANPGYRRINYQQVGLDGSHLHAVAREAELHMGSS